MLPRQATAISRPRRAPQPGVRHLLHLEKIRIIHDATLWGTSVLMLGWSIHLWTRGSISPGQVVMLSALTFRILFGSRDLAWR